MEIGVGGFDGEVEILGIDEVAHIEETVLEELGVQQQLAVPPTPGELWQSLFIEVG